MQENTVLQLQAEAFSLEEIEALEAIELPVREALTGGGGHPGDNNDCGCGGINILSGNDVDVNVQVGLVNIN